MSKYIDLFQKIYNPENLYHAWCKTKYIYDVESDFVFERDKIVQFEANLEENIQILSRKIEKMEYCLSPLIPMALPKGTDDENNRLSRQNFYVCLEDQIVWIAVINIIGPILDTKMPFWSFGNRLYMSIWKEEIDDSGKAETKFGRYRPSSRKIYRNWSSSWPLFRKAVSITVKEMSKNGTLSDEEDEDKREYNEQAPVDLKILYWDKNYWQTSDNCDIFYATIDLEKFYPSINAKDIFTQNTMNKLYFNNINNEDANNLQKLLKDLLDFKIIESFSVNDLDVFPHKNDDIEGRSFLGLPTGLFVAGFLSNIAMLDVDLQISKKIESERKVAHFRFVDDHVFLATSIDELEIWIREYEKLLCSILPRSKMNNEKTQPSELAKYLEEKSKDSKCNLNSLRLDAEKKCRLDKDLPSPFTTLTIKKMSGLNKSPIEIMDENEKMEFLCEIEHILATEFPDEEIKKGTRVSWAASIISRTVPTIEFDVEKLYRNNKEIEIMYYAIEKHRANKEMKEPVKQLKIKEINVSLNEHIIIQKQLCTQIVEKENRLYSHVFSLLLKALKGNISKPKIWKKLIGFCFSTGYNGLDQIIDTLDSDKMLTKSGKSYILATVISEIAIKIVMSSEKSYTESCASVDTSRKRNYFKYSKKLSAKLYKLKNKYNAFFLDEILIQYELAKRFVECEINDASYFNFENETEYQICYLWFCLTKTIKANRITPPKAWFQLQNLFKTQKTNIVKSHKVTSKLLLMYPEYADITFSDLFFEYEILTYNMFKIINIEKADGEFTNLYAWYVNNAKNRNKPNKNGFDLQKSEWAALEICKQIIKNNMQQPEFKSFEPTQFELFYNCHPCNFLIKNVLLDNSNNIGWAEFRKTFTDTHEGKNEYIIHKQLFNDIRFCSDFYNQYGRISNEKKQVYSLGILLLILLSPNFTFSPIVNRGDAIDKKHYMLLDMLEECNISSYTRAIIVSSLSYRSFELQYLSFFDRFFKRDDDDANDPIENDTIDEMLRNIENAQSTLEYYQLSLENNAPRQLIPISFENMTKSYNPYIKEDD